MKKKKTMIPDRYHHREEEDVRVDERRGRSER